MRWSKAEDDIVIDFIKNTNNRTFKDLHGDLPGRTIDSIKMRYRQHKKNISGSHATKIWTENKIEVLLKNYKSKDIYELSEILGIKYSTVYAKLKDMGLTPKYMLKSYTEEDDLFIKNNYKKIKTSDIAFKLGVSPDAVIQRASKLGLNTSKTKNYTEDEKSFIIENYSKAPISEISKITGRSYYSINNFARKNNLISYNKIRYENNVKFILDNYESMTDSEISRKLSLSIDAVENIRKNHGIYKSLALINGISSIEKFVKDILDELSIKYIYCAELGNFKPDFLLENGKIIEVNGDYWHCNPYVYCNGPEDEIQAKHVLRDYSKKCYYLSNNIDYIELWEYDINHNPDSVKEKIKAFCRS